LGGPTAVTKGLVWRGDKALLRIGNSRGGDKQAEDDNQDITLMRLTQPTNWQSKIGSIEPFSPFPEGIQIIHHPERVQECEVAALLLQPGQTNIPWYQVFVVEQGKACVIKTMTDWKQVLKAEQHPGQQMIEHSVNKETLQHGLLFKQDRRIEES